MNLIYYLGLGVHNDSIAISIAPSVFAKEEQKMKRKKLARLQNLAASLNYQLTPLQ